MRSHVASLFVIATGIAQFSAQASGDFESVLAELQSHLGDSVWLLSDHLRQTLAAKSDSAATIALRMQVACAFFAGAALRGYTELKLHIVKRSTAARHLNDGSVRNPLADANDHILYYNVNESDSH